MESSRVFVKGLPPNLSPDYFKEHFSKQFAITDARLIPHRRIGYVGYKTPEDAAKAVRYHNKSFIRMSRINVELARPIEDQHALGVRTNSVNDSESGRADFQESDLTDTNTDEKRKRKREGAPESEGNPKLQEFLEVMRPPSKSNIWENQNAKYSQGSARLSLGAENAMTPAAQQDEAREHVPKKRKKERQVEGKDVVPAEVPEPPGIPSVDAKTVPSDRDLSEEATRERMTESLAVSDADWLRARTSRLLGLMDDEDVQATPLPEEAPTEKASLSEIPELVNDRSVSDASVQTDEELEVEGAISENEAAGNGRLFVRNLTYTVTEEDLRKHFEDRGHGTIEEVSPGLHGFLRVLFWSDSYDEHPDRDSLRHACDVTRKKFLVEHFLILKNEPHPLFFYIEDFLCLKC